MTNQATQHQPDASAVLHRARAAYAEATAPGYGACLRCDHVLPATTSSAPRCGHATALAQPIALAVARAAAGVCGPDANLLRTGGWDYQ